MTSPDGDALAAAVVRVAKTFGGMTVRADESGCGRCFDAGEVEMARGLAAAGWSRWPDEQAGAVAGFLRAWWMQTLRSKSPPGSVRSVFESCVTASSSVTSWLALWEEVMSPVARRHLADCVDVWSEELSSGWSPFTWWWGTEAEEQAAWSEVRAWLAGQTRAAVVPEG
ncbi:hypothetical protein ACIQM4_33900 [Streptomyces sp. NPDC091272]|uniref:hypothetical protein n=1 Tax=Streptomyces sp. NPDC091272 TaxID=3365981 RepID=UPI003810768E